MSETVKAVERASEILLLLHSSNELLGIGEIADRLDLQTRVVQRLLDSFLKKGLVRKTENEKYGVGTLIFAMGLKVSNDFSILEIIKPYTRQLMLEVGEAVNASILDESVNGKYRTILVDKEYMTDGVIHVNPEVGSFADAHISAVGKCLLAFSKKVDLSHIHEESLTKYTRNSIYSKKDLLKEIDEVRRIGYAVDNEEREVGLFCVAVPIFDSKGDAFLAISISGPVIRMNNDRVNEKIEALTRTQAEINQVLRTLDYRC